MAKKIIKREHYQEPVGRSLFIYAGHICNNNCIFCFEKDQQFSEKNTKSLKKEIKVIRENFEVINFMGREPTLRKDLAELILYAKKLGFSQIGLTTNGRMLAYADLAKRLVDSGLTQFVITVAGADEATHDWHTQSKGSFAQTLAGIKNAFLLRGRGVSVVVNIMVTRKNFKQLVKMVDFYVMLGAKEINIGHILPFNQEIINSKKLIAKMSEVAPYLIKIEGRYGQKIKLLFVEYPPCVFPEKYRHLSFPCLEESPQKIKFALCSACSRQEKCAGIHPYYINLYGTEEFKL